MKIILLHGLGQTAQAWKEVVSKLPGQNIACPELFAQAEGELTYDSVLAGLEKYCAGESEPFVFCGLSLGGVLALDYAVRHPERVAALVLIGAQYRVPTRLIDFQNLLFRLMPQSAFAEMGLPKQKVIALSHSMRTLDLGKELHRVSCPATVLCGEKDQANRKAAQELQALLPKAVLQIVPGAGHEMNLDAPEAIAQVLQSLTC